MARRPPAQGGEVLSATEEQDKWLADALNVVKQQAFYMKRALDAGNLREALKYASSMLSELRTSKLSPQKYYELYMAVFGELQRLEVYFGDESLRGKHACAELYEVVQHAGNIVPRLYLMCTVGSVYVKSKEGPAKEVLNDLAEICKGVQHPIRGLFLRAYLTQISRDKLPDTGSPYEGEGGTVADAIDFLVQNFTEMNKLWVRMQHQGPAAEKSRREQERRELRDLVGKNVHMLSQLEGVTLELYKTAVLPRLLEQVVSCKDEIAQHYLMDCIIQVFPDDFHLHTLDTLLGACPQLQPGVDVTTIMSQLMTRLSNYATANAEALPVFLQVDAFSKFSAAVTRVNDAQPDMAVASIASLHVALMQFVVHVHKDRLDYANQVLASCVRCLDSRPQAGPDTATTKHLVQLLSLPLEKLGGVPTVLQLEQYPALMAQLDAVTNKAMAVTIVKSVLGGVMAPMPDRRANANANANAAAAASRASQRCVTSAQEVDGLFLLIRALVYDDDTSTAVDYDAEDLAEEQNLVARIIHCLTKPDEDTPSIAFEILSATGAHLLKGGPKRIVFTLPPLIFELLKLVRRTLEGQANHASEDDGVASVEPQTVFVSLHKMVTVLAEADPPLALKLSLQCAEVASTCGLEPIAYDLFTHAFIIYEEDIADSKVQIMTLHLIIGTLQRCFVFTDENRDALTHKASGYSSKLLKKADQCRAVYRCAHLFWSDDERGYKDGERVLLCLKRALKIANAAQQVASATHGGVAAGSGHITLLVEILNRYLYFFDRGNEHITVTVIQGLLQLIRTELSTADAAGTAETAATEGFFRRTVAHIREQKMKAGAAGERYSLVQV